MKVSKKEILELIDNMNIYTLEVGEYNYDVVIDKYDLLEEIEKLFEDKKE